MSISAGDRFGPCKLVRPIGRGGAGEVWLAKNKADKRFEAVKVLRDEVGERDRERFIREAQTTLAIEDDRIVRTYEVGEAHGRLFIRMEYVEGESLDKLDRAAPAEAVKLFKRMAAALAAGHARGIVHRDVKPSNFIRTPEGRVKLTDFGIARPPGTLAVALTATGDALGTPAYMSPEQWADARKVDARADVYSLGVTFYRLLAGRLPFDADPRAPGTVFYAKLLTEDPVPLEPAPGVPEQLPNVILRAMAKRPEERFPDAVAVFETLQALDRDPDVDVVARPASEQTRRRSRAALGWGLAVGVGIALAVAVHVARLLLKSGP